MPEFYYRSMCHHVGDHPMAIWFAISGRIRYINRVMSAYRSFSAPTSWTVRMRDIGFVENRLNGAVEMYKSALRPLLSVCIQELFCSGVNSGKDRIFSSSYSTVKKVNFVHNNENVKDH